MFECDVMGSLSTDLRTALVTCTVFSSACVLSFMVAFILMRNHPLVWASAGESE